MMNDGMLRMIAVHSTYTRLLASAVEIIYRQKRAVLLLCIVMLSLLCFQLLHMLGESMTARTSPIAKSTVKQSALPRRNLCRRSDGSTFVSTQLPKLTVKETDPSPAYIKGSNSSAVPYISNNYSNLTEFIEITRAALMSRRFPPKSQSISLLFHRPPHFDLVKPSCDGLWMEFGVYQGKTVSQIAHWKSAFCGIASEPVYGFDTFTGLPTDWRAGYKKGTFNLPASTYLSIPSNVVLRRGLFIDTLPLHLRSVDYQHRCHTPVSLVHIDCDLYEGTRDVLFLLGSRFVSGTILIFDELFNYPHYEKHEIKALFEFMIGSNLRLIPMGTSTNIDLHPGGDGIVQSFAFIVDLKESTSQ